MTPILVPSPVARTARPAHHEVKAIASLGQPYKKLSSHGLVKPQ